MKKNYVNLSSISLKTVGSTLPHSSSNSGHLRPIATIFRSEKGEKNKYEATIGFCIPAKLNKLKNPPTEEGTFIDTEQLMSFNYMGWEAVDLNINSRSEVVEVALAMPKYQIRFNADENSKELQWYEIAISFDAIDIPLIGSVFEMYNEDPETSRGTVTLVRKN
jgi:hypothetical protein